MDTLSTTELTHRLKNLNRSQRRKAARDSWDRLELWRDPAYHNMTRQGARAASWKAYWAMFRSDFVPPTISMPKKPKTKKSINQMVRGFLGGLKSVWDYV